MEKTFYLNSSFETKALSKKSKSIKIAGYANTTAKDHLTMSLQLKLGLKA